MILAHDLGTTSNKASLYRDDGAIVASVTVSYPVDFGVGGKAEQHADDWWQAVAAATRQLLSQTHTSPAAVACVVFSGQMMGAVLLDAQGQPLRPAIIWADTRSQREADHLIAQVGMERAYAITGHRINATYSLSKLMWVRANEPALWARVRHVLLAKDYVAFCLTGRMVTDPSDASSMNAYDQRSGHWSDELLGAAAIDPALLPEIVASTAVVGGVTPAAARITGLLAGTPVVIGGGDGPAAALGAGIIAPDSGAYAYLGSSSWVSLAADQPLYDPYMRTMTFNHVIPGRFVPTATMQAGGASLEWVVDLLAPGHPAERYGRLFAEAAEVAAAEEGLLFLPHLLGERSPYWNPRARGAFIGLAKHHGQAHMVRAVLEGVAMNLLTGLRAFEEQGSPVGPIDAIGGGARSDVWLQILADTWGRSVRRRSLVDEANSLGAAIIGGVAVGLFKDFTIAPSLSQVEQVFLPDMQRHALLIEQYGWFLEAYQRLEPVFDALQRPAK
jgi:xylulokinase